ncbi:MAG: hypothetical protein M0P95_17960 [Sulfuritalea sp.]|jgi:hypothetical protein|nr:hypothetical protein [Sulfuritalea sp.]
MLQTKVKRRLDAIAREARTIHTLNHGGCCVFASLVCDALVERGYKVRGVVCGYEGEPSVDEVHEMIVNSGANPLDLSEWHEHGIYFNHVILEVKIGRWWYLYDSTTWARPGKTFTRYDVLPGRLTQAELASFAANDEPGSWNTSFDRARHIPKLKDIVIRAFEDIA